MVCSLPLIVVLVAQTGITSASPFRSLSHARDDPQAWGFFTNNTIYKPTCNESLTYPRYTELQDGTILATTSLSSHSPKYFPVFASKDGGASWEHVSDIHDTVNGWGLGTQPALAELREPLGGFEAGTVLASGNSASRNGTHIDLYASTDKANTWKFVGNIAKGGAPNTTNGATPIWEPYLLVYNHSLVCYYSDQRDPKHGQKLAHQVSKDLKTWDDPVDDVAYDLYIQRPGMTVVAYIPPVKKWILVHENPKGNSSSYGSNYPVYYVLADNPLDFRLNQGKPIVVSATDGHQYVPNASPYVVWSPIGGPNGTIVVSDADRSQVYTNRVGGAIDKWESHATPAGATYSRAIGILEKYPDHLLIFGGETFRNINKSPRTPFTATVVNLTQVLQSPACC